VIQLWLNGTWTTDANTGHQVINEPGRFVLFTDESLISEEYSGASMRDGQLRGRRISSAAFSFSGPVDMTKISETELICTISIDPNDRLNPFSHKYHPDHDDLDGKGSQLPADSMETYTVTRQINLTFTAYDPETAAQSKPAGWGNTDIGGFYSEKLSGLHKQDIFVEGIFRLHRVCTVEELNDGINQ